MDALQETVSDLLEETRELKNVVNELTQEKESQAASEAALSPIASSGLSHNEIANVNKFVRQAISYCYGRVDPVPYPSDKDGWPMDGARKLIRWDLDQTFQAKVNQRQMDTILDIIKMNPSLVDTGRNLDITALPLITDHLDVYNYACKRFFNQFKAKLMEVKIKEYQSGGKKQLEAKIEQRRTESKKAQKTKGQAGEQGS